MYSNVLSVIKKELSYVIKGSISIHITDNILITDIVDRGGIIFRHTDEILNDELEIFMTREKIVDKIILDYINFIVGKYIYLK